MDTAHRVMVLDFGDRLTEADPSGVRTGDCVQRVFVGDRDEPFASVNDTVA